MLKERRSDVHAIESAPGRVIAFDSGRVVALERTGTTDQLYVTDPHGRFEIGIRFTEAGPVLDVSAIALNVRTDASVVVDCDRFHVHAREAITLETSGDLVEQVAGDHRVLVDGEASVSASNVRLHAEDEIEISATADTRIDGRRVLLNC